MTTDLQDHQLEAAARERQHYLQAFKFFIALTLPLISIFALFHLGMGRYSLFASILPVIVILLACRVLVTGTRYREAIYVITIAVIYLHFLRLLYAGAEHGSNIVWMLCFPISCYLLLGRTKGSLAMAVSLLGIVLAFYGPPIGLLEKYPYPAPTKARFLIAYSVIAVVSLWYESVRLTFRNEMEQRHLDLLNATRKIEQLSVTDKLTGCYNRRYLEEGIKHELDRAKRFSHSFAMILCDIDHFKAINDKYGHANGDLVLAEVAARLRDAVRHEVDWVVRYGGEEFLVILPETTLQGANALARRIQSRLSDQAFITANDELIVTASFGVKAVQLEPVSDISFADLFAEVDQLLYKAKADGRNRIVYAPYASSEIGTLCQGAA